MVEGINHATFVLEHKVKTGHLFYGCLLINFVVLLVISALVFISIYPYV